MTEKTKEVVVKTPSDMIALAVQSGADLEKLEKLLTLQERWDANEAKKAYHKAMSLFKENPPSIEKDKTVRYKDVKYNHASLANVTSKINKALSIYGLSASWSLKQNGQISVTCKITHEQGYSEETTITAPSDTSGSKNSIQAIGSTISYLERYTILALTGLATEEMEDDGRKSGVELISLEEKNLILDRLLHLNIDQDKFLEYMKLDSLENMPASDRNKALTAIDNADKKKKEKELANEKGK